VHVGLTGAGTCFWFIIAIGPQAAQPYSVNISGSSARRGPWRRSALDVLERAEHAERAIELLLVDGIEALELLRSAGARGADAGGVHRPGLVEQLAELHGLDTQAAR